MTLGSRIERLEQVAGLPRVISIRATDETDFVREFEGVLLSEKPGPAILDIDISGVRSRQTYRFLTHEERLELLK